MIKSGGIDKFILKVEKDNRAKDFETGRTYKGVDGQDIIAVNVNTERWYATQIGTIVALPARISDRYNIPECKIGDELVIHHNVTTAFDEGTQQLIREFYWEGEQYFHVEPEAIFALLKGEDILPFGNRIFLEPIKNEEQNVGGIIIPPQTEWDDRHGIVRYFSEQGNGISEGDKAFFIEGGFYSVLVKNKRWLVPVQSNLYGKVVDDELIPYGNYVLVEPEKQETSAIYVPDSVSSIKPLYGTVISKGAAAPKYIRVGSKVGFRPANHPKYKDYYILSEDRIHYGEKLKTWKSNFFDTDAYPPQVDIKNKNYTPLQGELQGSCTYENGIYTAYTPNPDDTGVEEAYTNFDDNGKPFGILTGRIIYLV